MKESISLDQLLSRLEGVQTEGGRTMAKCPAHEDKKASLSITQADGKILLNCFANCSFDKICDALGISQSQLFDKPLPKTSKSSTSKSSKDKKTIIATYDYLDREGKPLFQAVRFEPKGFSQRRLYKGNWVWGLDAGIYAQNPRNGEWFVDNGKRKKEWKREEIAALKDLALYRAAELRASDSTKIVFIVEGEKDADRLRDLGAVAVCNPRGAGKWRKEFNDDLRGRRVVIIADNDLPGRDHAIFVAESLHGVAQSVKVLLLENEFEGVQIPDKGDISDFFKNGGTIEVLQTAVDKLLLWSPPVNKTPKRIIATSSIDFQVDERGLWATEDNETTLVGSPIYIEALTRDVKNMEWGRLLRLIDHDGIEHTWVMPAAWLAGEGQTYRDQLLRMGVDIKEGNKPRRYLDAYLRWNPKVRARCVDRVGWFEESYTFPDCTVGAPNGEQIYLSADSANHLLQIKGTLSEWQNEISHYAIGNSRLAFAISAAFAGALLSPLGGEPGGFHFYGSSSKGKSTMQFVAGSVYGGGTSKGFLKRWRVTDNGLEAIAVYHNDGLLCLDEIAQCDPRELGSIVYMLGNGQGKIRSQKNGGVRQVLEWQNMVLSSGELTIEAHMAVAGQKAQTGQEVRIVNLPAESNNDIGVFDVLHKFKSGEEFSKHLVTASCRIYGSPIRTFIEKIISQKLLNKIRLDWVGFREKFVKSNQKPGMATEVSRVLDKFALVAYAGKIASELSITGWPQEESSIAATRMFEDWLKVRGTAGSVVDLEILRKIKGFIERYESERFQRIRGTSVDSQSMDEETESLEKPAQWQNDHQPTRNRVGYIKPDKNGDISAYHFLPESFRQDVCIGFDIKQVINALRKYNLLIADTKRDQAQLRVPEKSYPIRVYSISANILR